MPTSHLPSQAAPLSPHPATLGSRCGRAVSGPRLLQGAHRPSRTRNFGGSPALDRAALSQLVQTY